MKKFLDHNASVIIASVYCVIAILWFYGCQAKVANPFNPALKITRAQLDADVTAFDARIKAAYTDLEQQELIRQKISEHLSLLAEGGAINPTGILNLALGILGVGSILTYRKKDSVIKALKNNARTSNQTTNSSSTP